MKNLIKICALGALLVMGTSCAKHDFFDDDTITGKVGPESYWEVASSAVTAGGAMEFTAQYYSSVSQIDHSEVWYDIVETIDYTVTCPWLSTFTYSKTSNSSMQKRVAQKIKEYPHNDSLWSDKLHAYTYTSSFPVSGTLAPFTWSHPEEFDSTKMVNYFGDTFMQSFKDGIKPKMQFADYKKMYLGLGILDDFKQYTDSTLDPNQGEDVWVYHFPKDPVTGEEVVPAAIDSIWDVLTFKQLVENSANGYYEVDYNRNYKLNAVLRVYDVRGVYGKTVSKEITIN